MPKIKRYSYIQQKFAGNIVHKMVEDEQGTFCLSKDVAELESQIERLQLDLHFEKKRAKEALTTAKEGK